ncbi:MAG: phage tail protein [Halobacteriota archaeon]
MAPRADPYRQMRFLLEIDGLVIAGFSRCDLSTTTSSVIEYREGNESPTPRKLPGLNTYGPLVLETGVTDQSFELFEWRALVEQGNIEEARRLIAVVLLDAMGMPAARWTFREAWPSEYEAPRLSATTDEVAIERLFVVHEGFGRVAFGDRADGEEDTGDETDDDDKPTLPTGDPRRGIGVPKGDDKPFRSERHGKQAHEGESDKT